MLIFGPYRAIPKDENFVVFNLSSSVQAVPRLPGLIITPRVDLATNGMEPGEVERNFDFLYYNYIINNPVACSSLMSVLMALRDSMKVYVCISEYESDPLMSILNESFMKVIQSRYDIKYSIINNSEDYKYIPDTGCDFMSVDGIYNFDQDLLRMEKLKREDEIMRGNYGFQ